MNHTFLGGNNPRTESEELEGLQGDDYKIRNRSNSAYGIREEDLSLLSGVYTTDTTITINYESKAPAQPTAVYLVPETVNLGVGEKMTLNCRLEPEGDYEFDYQFKITENLEVASISGKQITGETIGFAVIEVNAKGDGWSLDNTGSVIVSGLEEEKEGDE